MPDDSSPNLELTLEKGRYRLYVAPSCPFAHRVRLMRSLQDRLEDVIEMTWATGKTKADGWCFQEPELEFGAKSLKEVFSQAAPSYEGKYSVPLLVDRTTKKMVHNDSLEIAIALAKLNGNTTLCPKGAEELAQELAGAVTMAPYKFLLGGKKTQAAETLWAEFDKYEARLEYQPYLMGDNISVADCVLWATLIRYEIIYARQFHLEGKTLRIDYPNLTAFVQRIWNTPSKTSNQTLGEEARVPDMIRQYWQMEDIAKLAGHDPNSKVPEMAPVC